MNASNRNATRILSLAESKALLEIYETMVETARTHDWNRLVEIERQAAALREAAIARPSAPDDEENVKELAALLVRIQHIDQEIRSLVEPAHEQARQQLAVEVKDRTVRETYGKLDPPGG